MGKKSGNKSRKPGPKSQNSPLNNRSNNKGPMIRQPNPRTTNK